MLVDAKKMGFDAFYGLMVQAIIPRPIAWVLSENADHSFNVAPFSFFNGVSSEPPLIMISVGWKDDKTRKDTWVNIDARDAFVVHLPPVESARAVVATSATLPPGRSEIDLAGLKTVAVDGMRLPRLEGPKAAFFCRKHKIIEVGDERQGLILGEIAHLWLDDGVVSVRDGRATVDVKGLDPLARLGGKGYAGLGPVFEIVRPK